MRIWFVVLAIVLAGCSSSEPAQDVDPDPVVKPEPTPESGAIVGVVVDETITPLIGTTVTMGDEETLTDATGAFVFNGVQPGAVMLATAPEGYFATAVEALVTTGQITEVQLVVMTDNRVVGYHSTLTFDGMMEAYIGPASLVAEALSPGATGCKCTFDLEVEDYARTFIIEAFGDESLGNNPVGDDLYWELIGHDNPGTSDNESRTVSDGGSYPIYGLVSAGTFEPATKEFQARVSGGQWFHAQESYELFVTVFYVAPAPSGWSIDG